MEGTGRRRRRPKQLLIELKEEKRYWKLLGGVLDRTEWRTCFGRNYGTVARQATE
jgi:hypothetical protein